MNPPAQTVPTGVIPAAIATGALRIVGIVLTAGIVAGAVAVSYRWYAKERVPESLAVLAGLAVVAIYLSTTAALSGVMTGSTALLSPDEALVNTVIFLLAAAFSVAGARAGDRLTREVAVVSGTRELDEEVSRLVQTVGRVIAVTLPESPADVGDIEGYEPVTDEVKAALADKTLLFPRGLTVATLADRLAERLKDDYGVGHVDVELAEDGTVEYLALGSRASGIGPTLPPGSAATAVLADPPYAASSGDLVQVWGTDGDEDGLARITTGELRARAGDVVTLAVDDADAAALHPDRRYRLVTLPSEPRADREFAALLRAADETMAVVTVEAGSDLVGTSLEALDVTVVAVGPEGGTVEAIPRRSRSLAAGDRLYAIARPDAIRRLEGAAESPEPEPS